jgi:hypothetical protein
MNNEGTSTSFNTDCPILGIAVDARMITTSRVRNHIRESTIWLRAVSIYMAILGRTDTV